MNTLAEFIKYHHGRADNGQGQAMRVENQIKIFNRYGRLIDIKDIPEHFIAPTNQETERRNESI